MSSLLCLNKDILLSMYKKMSALISGWCQEGWNTQYLVYFIQHSLSCREGYLKQYYANCGKICDAVRPSNMHLAFSRQANWCKASECSQQSRIEDPAWRPGKPGSNGSVILPARRPVIVIQIQCSSLPSPPLPPVHARHRVAYEENLEEENWRPEYLTKNIE